MICQPDPLIWHIHKTIGLGTGDPSPTFLFPTIEKGGHKSLPYIIYCILRMRKKKTAHFRVRCILALSTFLGRPSIVLPSQVSGGHLQAKKNPQPKLWVLCWRYLSSRAVARQVLSAQTSLTSVFGMGTGGPSLQSTPTHMDGVCPIFYINAPSGFFAACEAW